MDLQKIKALIDLMAHSRLSELDLEEGECRLRIVRNPAPAGAKATVPVIRTALAVGGVAPAPTPAPSATATPISASTPASTDAHTVTAPMYGVFCLTPAPGEAPFVGVGDTVRKGQKLCMLEAMKLFHSLEAERDGIVAAILAENGQEVDAGQPLFRIK